MVKTRWSFDGDANVRRTREKTCKEGYVSDTGTLGITGGTRAPPACARSLQPHPSNSASPSPKLHKASVGTQSISQQLLSINDVRL